MPNCIALGVTDWLPGWRYSSMVLFEATRDLPLENVDNVSEFISGMGHRS